MGGVTCDFSDKFYLDHSRHMIKNKYDPTKIVRCIVKSHLVLIIYMYNLLSQLLKKLELLIAKGQ